jgi:hypothetical protein
MVTPGSIRGLLVLGLVLAGSPHPEHGSHGNDGNEGGRPAAHRAHTETHDSLTCTWAVQGGGSVTCGRANGTGLRIVVSRKLVQVRSAGGAVVFSRRQPAHARGAAREPGAGVVFRYTEGDLLCEWTTAGGGGVFCGAADRHGYAAGLLPTVATVLSGSNDIVFIRKQQV